MELYHEQTLKLACYISGDKELGLFTLHKVLLRYLGYDWWDKQTEWTLGYILKCILYPALYAGLLVTVSVLTAHRCFSLDKETNLGFFIFMNNIIVIFTFMCAFGKTIYMKFFFGKYAKELVDMLEEIGDLKQGRPAWESSLKAFTYYLFLLLQICLLWTVYCLFKYHVFSYQTSYPWDQTTVMGWISALQFSFLTAFYTALIHSSFDSLISVSCGIMIGHLQVLIDILRCIGRPGSSDTEILRSAIDLHVSIIRAAAKMNYTFNILFSIQSVYTVLHACVLIFTFVKTDDILAALSNTMPMLMASYTQLFMYCYYSQKLTSKFDELTFAAYNNYWYQSSLGVQQGLLMLTIISKKQVSLRGLGNSRASFASYLSSIQDSVSYYLILKTITAGESRRPHHN